MDLMNQPGMKDITQEEVSKLTKAMKDKQFQSHMDEYCKEISDPAHRKEYLQYLDQLEAKGEMPDGQQLLRSEPGCCVKTTIIFKNGQTQKCFINIVHSERLEDMSEDPDDKGGRRVHMPYSLSPPRVERDNKGEMCMTCDFAVSTWTFGQAIQRPQILKMMVDSAADGLGSKYLKGFEEVKKDFKVMRRIRCRGPGGVPLPMSVRGELLKKGKRRAPAPNSNGPSAVTPSELREMRKEAMAKTEAFRKREAGEDDSEVAPPPKAEPEQQSNRIRVPQHKLVHVGHYEICDFMEATHHHNMLAENFSLPRELRLVVELPTVKHSSAISLDVTSCNVVIEVEGKYYLDLPLSYEIDEARGEAKFDKVKQVLTLELPVKPKMPDPERVALFGRNAGKNAENDDGALSDGNASSEEDLPPPDDEENSTDPQAFESHPTAEIQETPRAAPETSAGQVPEENPSGELIPEEELPEFIASDSFTGRRAGYVFTTREEGLGYYRDLKQPRPRRKQAEDESEVKTVHPRDSDTQPVSSTTVTDEPLIVEVFEDYHKAEVASTPSPPQIVLPSSVQQYVDAISLLSSQVPASDIEESKGYREPQLDWHQTRQNLMLLVDIPAENEVSGVQLSVVGRRLVLTFCTRPRAGGESGAGWQRNRVRQALCRAVDSRQWHAELPSDDDSQLVIVLRKVDQGEMWPEAFDSAATPEPWEPVAEPSTSAIVEEASTNTGAAAIVHDCSASGASPSTQPVALAPSADASGGDDSAELDIAPPAALGSTEKSCILGSTATSVNPAAAAAAAQSATVMGQAVLLRSRLMYQLL